MTEENINIEDMSLFDDQEEVYEVVTLVEGEEETDFFVIDGLDVDGIRYLLLVKTEDFDKDEPEAFIFKAIEDDESSYTITQVEDEAEYNKLMVLFQSEDSDYELK